MSNKRSPVGIKIVGNVDRLHVDGVSGSVGTFLDAEKGRLTNSAIENVDVAVKEAGIVLGDAHSIYFGGLKFRTTNSAEELKAAVEIFQKSPSASGLTKVKDIALRVLASPSEWLAIEQVLQRLLS